MKFIQHKIRFKTILENFGEFRSDLGKLGNFGLRKSNAMEATQIVYDLN